MILSGSVGCLSSEVPLPKDETIAAEAARKGVSPELALPLAEGVTMQFVLIPSGHYAMGAPDEPVVDAAAFRLQGVLLLSLAVLAAGCLLASVIFVLVRSKRAGRRPQFSLRRLLVVSVLAGAFLLSLLGYLGTRQRFAEACEQAAAGQNRLKWTQPCERPSHEVVLSNPFYMGRFEVTQAEYAAVMGFNPSATKWPRRPVETVSWKDAVAFCEQLSARVGRNVRLPTEAEWEFACRAGTDTLFCSGDTETDLDAVAWYGFNSAILGRQQTHPVGTKAPNRWGLYDMHGNVEEWCWDWWGAYPSGQCVDPKGPATGEKKVVRGGGWNGLFPNLRSTARMLRLEPELRFHHIGFRVVLEADDPISSGEK